MKVIRPFLFLLATAALLLPAGKALANRGINDVGEFFSPQA